MSTRQLLNRVVRLERLAPQEKEGHYTLEEICRSLWRKNKTLFTEIAKNNSYQLFVYQFQREDAAKESLDRRYPPRRDSHLHRS
jgi:hypothetical protein